MDIHEILQHLPHRYPMLLVDRVLECEPGKRILALKNVTINEPFFCGHFEQYPVMPGVLIIEALAQAAGILAIKSQGERAEIETSEEASDEIEDGAQESADAPSGELPEEAEDAESEEASEASRPRRLRDRRRGHRT